MKITINRNADEYGSHDCRKHVVNSVFEGRSGTQYVVVGSHKGNKWVVLGAGGQFKPHLKVYEVDEIIEVRPIGTLEITL